MSRRTRLAILLSVLFVLSAIFLGYYYTTYTAHAKEKALNFITKDNNDRVRVRPFSFVNQEGKTITEKDMEGRITVVNYFFATCEDVCPKMNENVAKVYKAYRGDKDVLFLSHTVDPETDVPDTLAAYGRRFDADPAQWMFLTGDKKKLYNQAQASYLLAATEDTAGVSIKDAFIHSQYVVLVDRHGNLRTRGSDAYDGLNPGDMQHLIEDIKVLKKEQ